MTMTTGTGPVPTVAPWQCAQCLGAYGKCIDESDNGHSTTCYGSSGTCLYLTKSTFVLYEFINCNLYLGLQSKLMEATRTIGVVQVTMT